MLINLGVLKLFDSKIVKLQGMKMAEEKELAQRVMLTMSAKLKEMLEKKAEEIGINTTQYIMNLIIDDIKNNKQN